MVHDAQHKSIALVNAYRAHVPGFDIRDKGSSRFMQTLYYLSGMFVWNRKFMDGYWTTIGRVIYCPAFDGSSGSLTYGPVASYLILRHEMQHIRDKQWLDERVGKHLGMVFWVLAYLFPQWLALLALLAFVNPWMLLFLVALAPWPAPGRQWIELRGYGETLRARYDLFQIVDDIDGPTVQGIIRRAFLGWGYYRMSWRRGPIIRYFERVLIDIRKQKARSNAQEAKQRHEG